MKMSSWSPEEQVEYKAVLLTACESAKTTRERAEAFLEVYRTALTVNQIWARDLYLEAEVRMAEQEIVNFLKSSKVAVAYNGKVIHKPRVIGTERQQADGTSAYEQTLFDVMTWNELETKAAEYLKSVLAHRGNLHVVTRLLELRDMAPGAANASEAAAALGITVEAWLADEMAS